MSWGSCADPLLCAREKKGEEMKIIQPFIYRTPPINLWDFILLETEILVFVCHFCHFCVRNVKVQLAPYVLQG